MTEPTQIPVAEEAEEAAEDTTTRVELTAPDPNSVNIHMALRNVSPLQLWAMARTLQQMGDQMYAVNQMQAMRAAQAEAPKPQDHKRKQRKAN